ncbi:LPXTG cell wall anchor domain-containing protein [Enterococcus sp. 5H]|uniref:LPXTG cell wall anchor domain-containing protein n=1 Tax=Enterococcus sp. 5H TaxID=1229490 RepID=UPI0023049451|nr:LPXTG cell wall anchor domain-containing protein [Enterococcus sp. 5H]MDA9470108.1 hypothetical protein [Enterococcus sp. 5H]
MKLKKVLLTCLLLFMSITSFSMISFSQTTDGQKTKMGVEYYDGNLARDQKTDESSFPNTSGIKPAGGNKLASMLPSTGEEAVKFLAILGLVLLIFSGMYYIKKWYQAFKA